MSIGMACHLTLGNESDSNNAQSQDSKLPVPPTFTDTYTQKAPNHKSAQTDQGYALPQFNQIEASEIRREGEQYQEQTTFQTLRTEAINTPQDYFANSTNHIENNDQSRGESWLSILETTMSVVEISSSADLFEALRSGANTIGSAADTNRRLMTDLIDTLEVLEDSSIPNGDKERIINHLFAGLDLNEADTTALRLETIMTSIPKNEKNFELISKQQTTIQGFRESGFDLIDLPGQNWAYEFQQYQEFAAIHRNTGSNDHFADTEMHFSDPSDAVRAHYVSKLPDVLSQLSQGHPSFLKN